MEIIHLPSKFIFRDHFYKLHMITSSEINTSAYYIITEGRPFKAVNIEELYKVVQRSTDYTPYLIDVDMPVGKFRIDLSTDTMFRIIFNSQIMFENCFNYKSMVEILD